jgi:hypothetical protein
MEANSRRFFELWKLLLLDLGPYADCPKVRSATAWIANYCAGGTHSPEFEAACEVLTSGRIAGEVELVAAVERICQHIERTRLAS